MRPKFDSSIRWNAILALSCIKEVRSMKKSKSYVESSRHRNSCPTQRRLDSEHVSKPRESTTNVRHWVEPKPISEYRVVELRRAPVVLRRHSIVQRQVHMIKSLDFGTTRSQRSAKADDPDSNIRGCGSKILSYKGVSSRRPFSRGK